MENGKPSAMRRVGGAFLVLAVVFLVLARLSYDMRDIGWFCQPPQSPPANWCGQVGSHLVFLLLMAFGDGYWVLPLLLGILCWKLLHVEEVRPLHFLWGVMLALPVAAIMVRLFTDARPDWAPSYGGFVGAHFGALLLSTLGLAGSWLLVMGGLVALWFVLGLGPVLESMLEAGPEPTPALATAGPAGAAPEAEQDVVVSKRDDASSKRTDGADPVAPAPVVPAQSSARKPADKEEAAARPRKEKDKEKERDEAAAARRTEPNNYTRPTEDILDPPGKKTHEDESQLMERARQLQEMFGTFDIGTKVIGTTCGPTITQFELSVDEGIKLSRITGLSDNVAMKLKAPSVRVLAPIPGRNTVGIEVPNVRKELVNLRSVIEHVEYKNRAERMYLPLILGKDVAGFPLIEDLAKMPHLLVAGTTGSGKSVCINSIIVSLLLHHSPESVRLMLIDPKMVEMTGYQDIPHLLTPVANEPHEAAAILEWACWKMNERYRLLSQYKVRELRSFNQLKKGQLKEGLQEGQELEDLEWPMPYIVIIVDEFGDLMQTDKKGIEGFITRLAQKSRAVGIHVILATQRPSANVITGVIKANMPSRIAFQVASNVDSRVILDDTGADKLLGSGDKLFKPPASSNLIRAQGVYVSDAEINRVVDHWKKQGAPRYVDLRAAPGAGGGPAGGGGAAPAGGGDGEDEGLYPQAVEVVLESGRPSASFIQRQMGVGYNKASRLIEMMEERGVVSPARGNKGNREVLMDLEQWRASIGAGDGKAG